MTDEQILQILNENKYLGNTDWHLFDSENLDRLCPFMSGQKYWPHRYLDRFGLFALSETNILIGRLLELKENQTKENL